MVLCCVSSYPGGGSLGGGTWSAEGCGFLADDVGAPFAREGSEALIGDIGVGR